MSSSRLGLAWWALAVGVSVGLWLAVAGNLRTAGVVLAVVLLAAAGARLVMPEDLVGGLRVRSRTVDVLMYVGFAVAVAVMFGMVKLAAF